MWTKKILLKQVLTLIAVNASKLKPHNILSDSLSIHVKRFMDTGVLSKPTSKKAIIDSNVVTITLEPVIICVSSNSEFSTKKTGNYWP